VRLRTAIAPLPASDIVTVLIQSTNQGAYLGKEAIMAEHKHGEMDITTHEKTFEGFIRYVVWGAAISIGALIFLALANA